MSSEDRSRAQLVLVAGLLIGLLLVGIALLLNGLLAAQNTVTAPGPSQESDGSGAYRQALEESVARSLRAVNADNAANASHATLRANLSSAVGNWSRTVGARYAEGGRSVDAALVTVHNGTRIRQTDPDRDLTAGGAVDGRVNWTLVEDVERPRRFVLTAETDSMHNATNATTGTALASEAFHVTVDAPSGVWRVYLFRGASTDALYVLVEDPTEDYDAGDGYPTLLSDACVADADIVTLRLVEGTVGGHACPDLAALGALAGPVDVRYNNTDQRRGTYDLLVNRTALDRTPYHDGTSGDSPFTQTALYAAAVDASYRSDDVTYETRTVVSPAPDTAGRPRSPPTVDSVTVSNTTTGTTPSFAVDWAVSDEDEDLKNVTVLLTRETSPTAGPVEVDSNATTATGGSATSPPTLTVEGGVCDVAYNVEVVVYDRAGGADETVHRELVHC